MSMRTVKFIMITLSLCIFVLGSTWYVLFTGEDANTVIIERSDIPATLNVPDEPAIPSWQIDRIEAYNDHFTSPYCRIFFSNGIVLVISQGSIQYPEMTEQAEDFGNFSVTVYTDFNNKVYQYRLSGLLYSYLTKQGESEEIMREYLEFKERSLI
ncbi:hypothetical protein [Paenibacillus sp. LBL]|uniref:hypothetical protein n=1 Tax=Paenibacillus sp. LBL TaxID=2940563 RepID=UPI002473BD18|nr:hypothetical protein [Paenibacillus sp. LBL]